MQIQHHPDRTRFEYQEGEHTAYLYYRLGSDDTIDLMTTFVPKAMRGRGLGRQLVEAAVRWARSKDLQLTASCWFAAGLLERGEV